MVAPYGVSILTGIGFTMSLFVGNLAFVNNLEYMDGVKIGVLTGSLLSTLFGWIFLYCYFLKMINKDIIRLASNTSNVGLQKKILTQDIFKKFNMWRQNYLRNNNRKKDKLNEIRNYILCIL